MTAAKIVERMPGEPVAQMWWNDPAVWQGPVSRYWVPKVGYWDTGAIPSPYRSGPVDPLYFLYNSGVQFLPTTEDPVRAQLRGYQWAGNYRQPHFDPLLLAKGQAAAPPLAPLREAAAVHTVPMQNELGYQMVFYRDNGVPIGATPASTPNYVAGGPIMIGNMSAVQPIIRGEQIGVGSRPAIPNPTSEGTGLEPTAGPCMPPYPSCPYGVTGGVGDWPPQYAPPGTEVYGMDVGGWPVYGRAPSAPAQYPPTFPITGYPLVAIADPPAAGPPRAELPPASSDPRRRVSSMPQPPQRRRVVGRTAPTAGPLGPTVAGPIGGVQVTHAPNPGTLQRRAVVNPMGPISARQQNPSWFLGGVITVGAGAAAYYCWPRTIHLEEKAVGDQQLKYQVRRHGCRTEEPYEASVTTRQAGVADFVERRTFAELSAAYAYLAARGGAVPASANPLGTYRTRVGAPRARNPVWPWALGATALAGMGAAAYACRPREVRREQIAMAHGATMTKTLRYEGCGRDTPYVGELRVSQPELGVDEVVASQRYGSKADALAGLWGAPETPGADAGGGYTPKVPPIPNPVWPWVLGAGALAATGGAAYLHCRPRTYHERFEDLADTIEWERHYDGCFSRKPWRATFRLRRSPTNEVLVEEIRYFDTEQEADAYLQSTLPAKEATR